jgi:hypothetical protein
VIVVIKNARVSSFFPALSWLSPFAVACAARSRNLHALLMVCCRHLEHYSQTLHQMGGGTGAIGPNSPASSGPSAGINGSSIHATNTSIALTKNHAYITQLLFFLRLFIQYILSNLSYEATLKFFAHLAVPDAVSKPNTPKNALGSNPYSADGNWGTSLTVPGQHRSRSASPVSPGGSRNVASGSVSGMHQPKKDHHTINLNPNSRRSSVNMQNADILTRFVCALVNAIEVLGDASLNNAVSTAKVKSGSGGSFKTPSALGTRAAPMSSPSVAAAAAAAAATGSAPPSGKPLQPLTDLHLELLNTLFVLLSTQMYLPLSTEFEQVFLDRLLYCAKPPMLNSIQGFVTGLLTTFTEILPADYASTVFQRAQQAASALGGSGGSSGSGSSTTITSHGNAKPPSSASASVGGFFSKITSKITNLLYLPVWAVRYLFTIPPNHPLIDRSTLLLELLVYQNGDNAFRAAVKGLKNADQPVEQVVQIGGPQQGASVASANHSGGGVGIVPHMPSQLSPLPLSPRKLGPLKPLFLTTSPVKGDYSQLRRLDQLEVGAISFSKLYYSLCSTLLSEHINLVLYTLIHENLSFRQYILRNHSHDLDYLLMPQLEILYREVDISKHHVYMVSRTRETRQEQPAPNSESS